MSLSGHVDVEYLVFNDITLWMNSTRGESEFKQSGSPADGTFVQATVHARRDGSFRMYHQGTLSEVISLQKGQSLSWPR